MDHRLNNQAIIVLGMHRSGTSAFSGLLNLFGVDFSSNLMPASPDNEAGYWEHQGIVEVHNKMLAALNSHWTDTARLEDGWWKSDAVAPFRAKLRDILVRDFSQSQVWALKDPRMCRLLPLWIPLLEELGCSPVFVLVARHPLESVKSLEKRDRLPRGKAEMLWLQHTIEAEHGTRGHKRVIVTFDQFLADWKKPIAQTQSALGRAWPTEPSLETVAKFLDPGKRHHRASASAATVSIWANEVFDAFTAGMKGDEQAMMARLDPIRTAIETAESLYHSDLAKTNYTSVVALKELSEQHEDILNVFHRLETRYTELNEKYRATKAKLAEKTAKLKTQREQMQRLEKLEKTLPGKLARFLTRDGSKGSARKADAGK